MWTTLIFDATAGLFLTWTFLTIWHLKWMKRLPTLNELARSTSHSPGVKCRPCSVVIAARDEEARIEETIRRLLAQREVEIELIVVDDRSADRTPDILQRLSLENARLRVRRVDALPDGWLGKCHACHLGASLATGEWILFTDADCWLKPDVLGRALQVADEAGADHVTLVSGLAQPSPGLKASHLMFLISLANWVSGVNRDQLKAHLGIGAFNLVRAAAYRQCGGYEALRLTVLDDVKLGLLLRRAGKRTRAFVGGDDAECHWGTTMWSMVKIMEKNYFAAVDYRLDLVIAGTLVVILIFTIILAGVCSGEPAGIAAALSPFTLIWPAAILARRVGWPWPCAVWVPAMFPFILYTLLNSTFVTLRRGGIRWRETFYPLAMLRAGNVRGFDSG